METIYKYPFNVVVGEFEIKMPQGSKVLSVQVQRGIPCIWALVDTDAQLGPVKFVVHGTGHPLSDKIPYMQYLGTFQELHGSLVWHLFGGISRLG